MYLLYQNVERARLRDTHIVHYLNNRHMGCYHTHDKLDLKPQVSGHFFFFF